MPSEDNKILEVNQYQISDKAPFDIYRDVECVIEDMIDIQTFLKIYLQQK